MKPFVIGIAGGSGAGKSTLVSGLQEALSGEAVLIQQEDYLNPEEAIPELNGFDNYEHPDAWNGPQAARDVAELKRGHPVRVFAKDHTKGVAYGERNGQWVSREPKPIILVEGFLIYCYPELREEIDLKIYLDAPFETHIRRRTHFIFDEYRERVLLPMHREYVEPSKASADAVIDVTDKTKETVLEEVLALIRQRTDSPE